MALVDYSSSEEEEDQDIAAQTRLKRKQDNKLSSELPLPPLPSKFHDLYASNTRVSTTDDPSLHGGRKRVTPHIEGIWPSHVYIEWYPSFTEHAALTNLISTLNPPGSEKPTTKIASFLTSDLGVHSLLHISLSRPIVFPTEKKDDFLESLKGAIKASGIKPFDITFSGLDWVPNFENTRWFLVLRLQSQGQGGLNGLLHVTNEIVEANGQPRLYSSSNKPTAGNTKPKGGPQLIERNATSEPRIDWGLMQDASSSFHISIAWTLEAPTPELVEATEKLMAGLFKDVGDISFRVGEIKVKVGNVVTSVPLEKKIMEEKTLFGF